MLARRQIEKQDQNEVWECVWCDGKTRISKRVQTVTVSTKNRCDNAMEYKTFRAWIL